MRSVPRTLYEKGTPAILEHLRKKISDEDLKRAGILEENKSEISIDRTSSSIMLANRQLDEIPDKIW